MLHCTATLGRGQPGLMKSILVWIMSQVQDWLLYLLTSTPACYHCVTTAPYQISLSLVMLLVKCFDLNILFKRKGLGVACWWIYPPCPKMCMKLIFFLCVLLQTLLTFAPSSSVQLASTWCPGERGYNWSTWRPWLISRNAESSSSTKNEKILLLLHEQK